MNPSRRVALVAAIYLGTFIASLDISIVNLALPTLQHALDTDLAGLQWVVDAYALCLSAFMLSSGPLSDRYGRKLTWLLGVALFSFGSLLCALATSLLPLLFGRAVQGIAGALLIPGALSILTQAFHDPGQRAQVIGGWTSFSALSLILGPLLGGLLVEHAGWQSIFLINLPLGLLALALGLWGIEETAHPEHAAFDPLGQLLSVAWLGALTYALIAAGESGWSSPTAWPALLLAGVGLLGFLLVERRTARPLLPLGLFRQARFAVCNLASFVLGFSGYASLFFLSLFFQQVQGASAQQAGLYLAPQFLAMGALSMLFGRLQRHVPLQRLLVLGYLVIGLAMLALAACGTGTAYPWIGLLLVALGLGMGLAVPGTGLAVMASVVRERSGMASATMNTLRQAGMAVGIALLGALLSGRAIVVLGDRLEGLGIADAQRLATQAVTAHRLPGSLLGLDGELPAALAEGFRLAMLVAGASALLAAALLWRLRVTAEPEADTVGASGRTAGVQWRIDRR
ncbi:MFS transporter [Pseudomonas aeruginosa]|uniref:Putative MFS transporter n=1 Tax=Pseudomonas paraeruginosa (strain DSM 24068 / PA7) TaxID=381754 RepID=A6V8P4_PSEP7|nr:MULTISPECIES: MFS transporter [Pseudomonas aeruginosa group]ABR80995.1 putative MFS transporter [Pseudomonas aeruginosa PA7]KSC94519.1 MFS transporter [Pseudomonas aeruginosa]KSD28822.1 MFS transporter [Pseudomonas aeruginosa]KSG49955.1 MFS transporter [Pseudomonas aeruginosa]MCW8361275.1 MFS transporter [Pseudomonas aeruginosa]